MNDLLKNRQDTPILSVCTASKSFGNVRALDDISFEVFPGELVGVLGENGAGKSTLFSLISGLNTPTSGSVELMGGDPRQPKNRCNIGVTPQGTGVNP
ncbi:ATP-binding cassette domain-containing protein [Corynebacterium macginleyi]|nr:ATP-binding cassette domain-containing protein [Corynebacterium macginleyi]